MRKRAFILLLVCFAHICVPAQYISRMHGFRQTVYYSNNFAFALGYSTIKSDFYKKHERYPVQSKEYYLINDILLSYTPNGKLFSINLSNSISFELNDKMINWANYNLGLDFVYQTNFSENEFQILPKIGLTLFYGTIEISYSRNILYSQPKSLSGPNVFMLSFRPYIFVKSQKEKWS